MSGSTLARWWRWLSRPWRSPLSLAATLIALAAPVLLLATSDLFRAGAADVTATERVRGDAASAGLTVLATGVLTGDRVAAVDTEIRERLAAVPGLGAVTRSDFVRSVGLVVDVPPPASEEPPFVVPGSAGLLLVRPGAVEALEAIETTGGDGLWISERQSERLELRAGDPILVQGAIEPIEVAGVFRDLWRDGPRDPYWESVPAAFVPTFSTVFAGPTRETYVLDTASADRIGLYGNARWDAELVDPPTSIDGLRELVGAYRRLENAATADAGYAAAIDTFDPFGSTVPVVASEADATLADVERRLADLEPPLVATTLAGLGLGAVATLAGAVFVAARREREHRLRRSDGDGFVRFAGSAFVEHLAPAAAATAIGVVGAVLAARATVPGSPEPGEIDALSVVLVAIGGLAVMSATIGWLAVRGPRPSARRVALPWLVPVVVLAAAAWVQVGRAGRRRDVDPLVVAFPTISIVAGVGVGAVLLAVVMRHTRRLGSRLPTVAFLAWRRIASSGSGAIALAVAIGASVGLVTYAELVGASLDRAVDAKVTTEVGGETQVLAPGPVDDLPANSTIVRRETTRLTVGNRAVEILAIDPATYADGVTVHETSGTTADEIVAMLQRPRDAAVAAVAVGDASFPTGAGFGTSLVFTFDVVGRVDAAPLARRDVTLLVDAGRLEEIGLNRHRLMRPDDVDEDAWDEQYVSVLRSYRRIVVSQEPADDIIRAVGLAQVTDRNVTTRSTALDRLENRAVRWSFDHLGLLAATSSIVTLTGLVLYLAQQRGDRALTAELARRMGVGRVQGAMVAVLEIVALALIAVAAGLVTARLVAGRVFGRFEPAPDQPPDIALATSLPTALVIGALAVAGVAVVAVVAHLGARRTSLAEVLRGR